MAPQTGGATNGGVAPVRTDHHRRTDLGRRSTLTEPHPDRATLLPQHILDRDGPEQVETRISPRLPNDEVKKVPLGDRHDVRGLHRQPGEVSESDLVVPNLNGDLGHLGVWQLPELLQPSQLMHQLQGRWMNGVSAEVTQEVGVLLQHDHVNTLPGQQNARDDARRATPGDNDLGVHLYHPSITIR